MTVEPGVYDGTPSVLVMERSATPTGVSVSVEELLPGSGSVVPPGAVTATVFARFPVAPGLSVAASV